MITLSVQVLVLILLYQVFLREYRRKDNEDFVYLDRISRQNKHCFYGFELGDTHTMFWPESSLCFYCLKFILITEEKACIDKGGLGIFYLVSSFFIFRPLALANGKIHFILTSCVFSDIIHEFSTLIFKSLRVGRFRKGSLNQ